MRFARFAINVEQASFRSPVAIPINNLAFSCSCRSLDQGLTHNYLKDTELHSLTEEKMKTRVVKLGPGSWAVFVNDQRHHELFLTRAAARKEARRQKEVNVSHTTFARLE